MAESVLMENGKSGDSARLTVDLAVIGAGPAGLAAALAAREAGAERILLLERDREPGGILNQCIHNGFGLHVFNEELTGPEYAERFVRQAAEAEIPIQLDTMVLDLEPVAADSARNVSPFTRIHAINPADGYQTIDARAVVLAMGCRERTRGAIGIPGDRSSGIFTAGAAQRYINREGFAVGRRVVILGSGDIGLIMARRLTLEGAKVLCVAELMPYSNGLARNIVQCLDDYDIPLLLSHTVVDVRGKARLESVTIAEVDERSKPIPGTEKVYSCDTLLLSVGLIPENELSRHAGIVIDPRTNGPRVFENRETSLPGVFACGNVLHVHDLVDFVTAESRLAGAAAAGYLAAQARTAQARTDETTDTVELVNGDQIGYTVPQAIRLDAAPDEIGVFMRVKNTFRDRSLMMKDGDGATIQSWKRLRLAPAEMERVTIKKSQLIGKKKIVFSVE